MAIINSSTTYDFITVSQFLGTLQQCYKWPAMLNVGLACNWGMLINFSIGFTPRYFGQTAWSNQRWISECQSGHVQLWYCHMPHLPGRNVLLPACSQPYWSIRSKLCFSYITSSYVSTCPRTKKNTRPSERMQIWEWNRGVTTIEAREATASSLLCLDCVLSSVFLMLSDDHYHKMTIISTFSLNSVTKVWAGLKMGQKVIKNFWGSMPPDPPRMLWLLATVMVP